MTVVGGAHHLDLRGAHPGDPPSVVAARKEEAAMLRQYLDEHYAAMRG